MKIFRIRKAWETGVIDFLGYLKMGPWLPLPILYWQRYVGPQDGGKPYNIINGRSTNYPKTFVNLIIYQYRHHQVQFIHLVVIPCGESGHTKNPSLLSGVNFFFTTI